MIVYMIVKSDEKKVETKKKISKKLEITTEMK